MHIWSLSPIPGTELLQPSAFPKTEEIKVSFVIRKSPFWPHLSSGSYVPSDFWKAPRMGVQARRTNQVIRGLECEYSLPSPSRRGEGLAGPWVSYHGQWLNHAYRMKPPQKFNRVCRLVNMWRCGESGAAQGAHGSSTPFPPTLPCASASLPSGWS